VGCDGLGLTTAAGLELAGLDAGLELAGVDVIWLRCDNCATPVVALDGPRTTISKLFTDDATM
jgi:hypothetical protein